ncbi:MAG: hypothetical protein K5695_10285 [Oscillospiraceae bacterium]|nr:hypothetical protein [Oscillospiraceae bacterium]
MKKTMMMAAVMTMAALTAVSFTGCGSAARTMTAAKAAKPVNPAVSAKTAAVKPAPAATEAATEAATAAVAAVPTEAVTEAATEAPKAPAKAETTTAKKAAKETKTEPTESRDADFKWFTTGVYKVSVDGSELDTYYVFSDKQNGRVDTVSGIGIGFTYEQNRNGVIFHMGCDDDTTLLTITDASMNTFSGTMYGYNYTFTRVQDAEPASFVASAYVNAKAAEAQTCDDGQNPVMNFIGNYSNGRAMMCVSAKGKNEALVTVSWGSSAFQTTKWIMSGTVTQVGDTLVMNYQDCDCESFFFNEDGIMTQSVAEYTNGCGSITFSGNQADWADFEQGVADGQVFSYMMN